MLTKLEQWKLSRLCNIYRDIQTSEQALKKAIICEANAERVKGDISAFAFRNYKQEQAELEELADLLERNKA